jgi:hypothetical protein
MLPHERCVAADSFDGEIGAWLQADEAACYNENLYLASVMAFTMRGDSRSIPQKKESRYG